MLVVMTVERLQDQMWLAPPKCAQLFLASDQVNLMVQKVNLLDQEPLGISDRYAAPIGEDGRAPNHAKSLEMRHFQVLANPEEPDLPPSGGPSRRAGTKNKAYWGGLVYTVAQSGEFGRIR